MLNYRSQVCEWTYQLSIGAFFLFFDFLYLLIFTYLIVPKNASESTYFQNFLGEHGPRAPNLDSAPLAKSYWRGARTGIYLLLNLNLLLSENVKVTPWYMNIMVYFIK